MNTSDNKCHPKLGRSKIRTIVIFTNNLVYLAKLLRYKQNAKNAVFLLLINKRK